ncbi:MAG: tetratricopeptide repeat protein [Actinomycetota bacterium]
MVDVTDATFQTEVLERSMDVAVVVDLWAPWCGPCKTLGPILETVIAETEGQVVLAKVNVDENPATSQAFQVQGIPAVYALRNGQVVDGFVGAQGEPAVREFIGRIMPSAEEVEIQRLIEAGDEASLVQVLQMVPDHHAAVPALAELLVNRGEGELALELLQRVPETADVRRIAALARTGVTAPPAGDAAAAPAGAPPAGATAAPMGGGIDLSAAGEFAAEDPAEPATPPHDEFDEKLTALLDRVKTDEDARQEFVDLLEVMGPADPRTAEYRKQLSMRLF